MKKIVLSLGLLALNVSAASTGWMITNVSAASIGWMTTTPHQANGVKFVLKTKHSLTSTQADLCADFISHGLALRLRKGMSADQATRSINRFMKRCEKKIYQTKEEEFLNAMSKADDQAGSSSFSSHEPLHPVYGIYAILLELMIAAKNPNAKELRLQLFGEARSGTCCTFFPPYIITELPETDSEEEPVLVDYDLSE